MAAGLRALAPSRLLHRAHAAVGRSLQARTVMLVAIVALIVAIAFSVATMVSVRSSQLHQVTQQARGDFSAMAIQAQDALDAADVSGQAERQQLASDLVSRMQSEGASNLEGVYLWGRTQDAGSIVPVSTEPTYVSLVSDQIRDAVSHDASGGVHYQPVELHPGAGDPGAVLGTSLSLGENGDLELFALYSFASQQRALTDIQLNLLGVCVTLSVMMGLLVWLVMRGIVRPVTRVADAAERLAAGDFDVRVGVDRHDEIGTLQRSFNEMAGSLEQKIGELERLGAMQRRFVSDVSHELRTPVTTMRMASDLLTMRKDEYDPTTRRTVELLDGQIGRFQDLLADLLEISRYDAGYAAVDLVETDVRDPLRTAAEQVDGIARARRVPVHVDLPNVPVLARVDARRLIRIVRNLLSNAVDFAGDWPIELRLAANRRAIVVSVRDHGCGMPVDQVPHVFERFWRGDPSRARITGGTGLGLSIAMTDARLHHGTIRVRSAPDEGAWFLVELPRDPDAGPVDPHDLPVDFVPGGDDVMLVTGGFGAADNRAGDYLDGGKATA